MAATKPTNEVDDLYLIRISKTQTDTKVIPKGGETRGSKKESEQYDQYFLNFEFILQIWHSQSDWRLLEPIRLFKFGRTFLCFDFWWIQCYKMWAFWVQLLQFFVENAILKWKLALIQKWIVIFEIVCNEKHGKWYILLTLLISISQIWTFSCKNLEKIEVYVMPYLKCPPNLKLIIFKLSNCSDSFLLPLR